MFFKYKQSKNSYLKAASKFAQNLNLKNRNTNAYFGV